MHTRGSSLPACLAPEAHCAKCHRRLHAHRAPRRPAPVRPRPARRRRRPSPAPAGAAASARARASASRLATRCDRSTGPRSRSPVPASVSVASPGSARRLHAGPGRPAQARGGLAVCTQHPASLARSSMPASRRSVGCRPPGQLQVRRAGPLLVGPAGAAQQAHARHAAAIHGVLRARARQATPHACTTSA
jgi:hypothetical protein